MRLHDIIDFFWSFHQLGFRETEALQEYEIETARMRNRWKLPYLRVFILRWAMLALATGMALSFTASLPSSPITLLVGLFLWTAWSASAVMTLFLVWLYSMRPHI